MRALSFQRHDTAVNIIAEAIQDGYKGAVKVLWDSGADETKQKDETRQTLPRWLFKDPQVVSRKRPDIVMLPRFRAGDDISKMQWVDPRSMYESQRKVLIVEVSYTQLSGMRKREQDINARSIKFYCKNWKITDGYRNCVS